ncbi:hypothetical protein AKJ09_10453 [Labilithrix luteola]|uniref:Uncharacterized protein n=1 Tax=Labilithrix luteola TaxID=1391654 RepID=A0A0K1QEE9_9BACT|nr:hypothetical protein AKJ09_10453 [Labilithrix luteola]
MSSFSTGPMSEQLEFDGINGRQALSTQREGAFKRARQSAELLHAEPTASPASGATIASHKPSFEHRLVENSAPRARQSAVDEH